MTIRAKKKPTYIYHFGDLDPSGVDAARDIEAKLRRYAPDAEVHFERPAVTREQVEEWNLPTRPTKQTDTRAKKFTGTSVGLDAIPRTQVARTGAPAHRVPRRSAPARGAEGRRGERTRIPQDGGRHLWRGAAMSGARHGTADIPEAIAGGSHA